MCYNIVVVILLGFAIETIKFHNIDITAWDIGGRSMLRPLWRHYYAQTKGVVFVVDSTDRDRLEEVIDQFKRFNVEEQLLGIPFLVFLNKVDLPKSMSINEITQEITKAGVDISRYHFMESVATKNVGVKEGMSWLEKEMKKKRDSLNILNMKC